MNPTPDEKPHEVPDNGGERHEDTHEAAASPERRKGAHKEPETDDTLTESGPEDRVRWEDDPVGTLRDSARVEEITTFLSSLQDAVGRLRPGGTASFNIFTAPTSVGTVVAGDLSESTAPRGSAGPLSSGTVPPHVLTEIRTTYVAPERYGVLFQRLRADHVLLLHAPTGWGRTTTALNLLDDVSTAGIRKLNPEAELATLVGAELDEAHGYLLESLEFAQAERLRAFHIERLVEQFRGRGCYLVVTVDKKAPLHPDLPELLLDGGRPADPSEIVRQHLAHRVGGADEPALDFVRRPDIDELVREVTSTGAQSAQRLVELAVSLAEVAEVADGRAELTAVRERFSAEWADHFRTWFDEQDATDQRAFVIALAVFNGLPERLVSWQAHRLADAIRRAESATGETSQPVFGVAHHARHDRAHAETFETLESTPDGRAPVLAVRFSDGRYPEAILQHVWTEYGDAREPIVRWLQHAAHHFDLRVRISAGATVGLLSLMDFEGVSKTILAPWADSPKRRHREAVLAALQLPIRQPHLAPLVSRMVTRWSKLHRNNVWYLRWTAARALGASVGHTMPEQAIRLLASLAEDRRLDHAICDSMIELFLQGQQDLVVRALLRWTASRNRHRRETGALCVVRLGYDLSTDLGDSNTPAPQLLLLAAEDERRLGQVTRLLRRAIDTPHRLVLAYAALDRWIQAAERIELLRDPLRRIFAGLATNESIARDLLAHLDNWRTSVDVPERMTSILRKTLQEKEVPA